MCNNSASKFLKHMIFKNVFANSITSLFENGVLFISLFRWGEML